jgi:hypothetical protein
MDYSIHFTTRIQKEEIEDLVSAQGGKVGRPLFWNTKKTKLRIGATLNN